jgi:cytochrome P450
MKVASEHRRPSDYEWPSAEVSECPFPFYESLRASAPVYKVPGRDEYLVSSWDDIAYIETHPELFSNSTIEVDPAAARAAADVEALGDGPYDFEYSSRGIAGCDPPEHRFKRKALLKIVSRERLASYEPGIRALCDELIDPFAARGEVELGSEFAGPLPLWVIVDILGLAREHREMFQIVGGGQGQASRYLSPDDLEEQARRQKIARGFIADAIRERYREPRQDFLTEMVQDQVERDGRLNVPYLTTEASTLLFAGMLTTWHTIVNSVLLLLSNPEQLASVRADRSLIRKVWEETLRLESPVQWLQRLVLEDTEVKGVRIPKGAMVLMLFASGNRDLAHWEDPDKFWPERPRLLKDHLGFGYGIHLCLGAPLARLEGEVALNALLDRLPGLRLAPGRNTFEHVPSGIFRSLRELYLEFDRA